MFSDIDTNKDNKISFEEFYAWWQYGRDNKLESLVALQLKALNLLSKAKVHFHKISSLILGNSSSNVNSHSVKLAVGSPENTKSAVNLKVLVGSNQEEFSSGILKGLNLGIDVPAVVFRFKCSNPQDGKSKLEEIVTNLLEMAKMMIPSEDVQQVLELVKTSFGVDGDYVVFGVTLDHPILVTLIYHYLEIMSLYLGNEFRGEFEADFGLNFDFNSFFDQKEKKVFEILGKGFHINLGLRLSQHLQENYTTYLVSLANKWIEKNLESKAAKFISRYSFLLLLKAFNLEIITKDFEDLQTKIAGTPLETGIAGIPNVGIGETLEGLKNEGPSISALANEMPIIQEIVDYFKTVKEEGSVTIQVPRVSIHLQANSNGADKILDYFMNWGISRNKIRNLRERNQRFKTQISKK